MALREPCEFTRSPTRLGRGSCTSDVAVIIEERSGGPAAGRGAAGFPPTRSTIAAMCSGVVPQQPPTTLMP